MKKLITVILILCLFLPAAAFAISESDVIGCYAYYEKLVSGAPAMYMIYFGPNHTCYYLIQAFSEDEPSLGRAYVGTWEVQSDGTIFAKTGNNTSSEFFIPEGAAVAYDKKLNQYYINISLYDDMLK
jgi:hypothetical protein